MNEILKKAHAKVNLRLKFEGRRDDGYHLLSMLNATISLADVIQIKRKPTGPSTFHVFGKYAGGVPATDENSCLKAAQLFFNTLNIFESVEILLEKNIPSQAGLGGGSSDAAAVLNGLADLYAVEIPLLPLAKQIGSDVPFFLQGGFQWVHGIGDQMVPLDFSPLAGRPVEIFVPEEKISTVLAYSEVRKRSLSMKADEQCRVLVSNLSVDYGQVLKLVDNDFFSVAIALAPSIGSVISRRSAERVFGLTGSGSCFFALENEGHVGSDVVTLPASIERIPCIFERT